MQVKVQDAVQVEVQVKVQVVVQVEVQFGVQGEAPPQSSLSAFGLVLSAYARI